LERNDMAEPVIQVTDFTKVYGEFVAVDGISFDVQRSEIFGLLGPNGAGKTTTLECLEGCAVLTQGPCGYPAWTLRANLGNCAT
jgi:ABC-type multidrug transport system ATPase subunit